MSSYPDTIIIPARLSSTRLPSKVLLEHRGHSLIKHVIDQALLVPRTRLIVATEDVEIVEHLEGYRNVQTLLTPQFQTGTSRSFYVATTLNLQGVVINWQADEPCIKPQWVDDLRNHCHRQQSLATFVTRNTNLNDFLSTDHVKVVLNAQNFALYFSRSPIPGRKDSDYTRSLPFFQHLGLYAIPSQLMRALSEIQTSNSGPLTEIEDLEQLAWLYAGFSIYCSIIESDQNVIGIDTEKDWQHYCNMSVDMT